MLVAFVEQSDGPSAAQIVDIAQVPLPPFFSPHPTPPHPSSSSLWPQTATE